MKKKSEEKKKNTASVNTESKTSIEKSHSAWSNFKLTSLSFLASCSFSGLFVFLGIKDLISDPVFYTGTAACALFIVMTLFLFKDFKR